MTSVPQLPVEPAPSKALPPGEAPRGRNNRSGEEGGEAGFAAVFAQALPELQRTARAVHPKGIGVEGEGIASQDVQASAVGDAQQAAKPRVAATVINLAATALVAPDAPVVVEGQVQELATETRTELGEEPFSTTETLENGPAARGAAEVALPDDAPEAGIVEDEAAPRRESAQSLEPLTEVGEVETSQIKPSPKAPEDRGRRERPHAAPTTPENAERIAGAAVRIAETAVPKAAPAQTDQASREPSTLPERKEGTPVPKLQAADESRRIVETPVASKTTDARAAGAAVIEFRVSRELPAQDVHQQPPTAGWTEGLQSKPAPQSQAAEKQPQQARATPSAEAVPAAKPLEKSIPVVAVAQQNPAPAAHKDIPQARLRPAEHGDAGRPLTQTVAALPQRDLGEDARSGRGGSGDAPEAGDGFVERQAQPNVKTPSVKNIVASLSVDPQADTEASKQATQKPLLAATTGAQPAHAQQTAPADSVPLPATRNQPPEAARPVAAASPMSEPAIAAKLQQESGRTTLHVVLQDERLGRVALQLVERGGWIETAIRASDPRTAQTLSNGAAGLFEALQQRGLTLAAGSEAAAWDAQEGQRRDNPQRDQEPQRRRFRLRRSGGEFGGALARAEV